MDDTTYKYTEIIGRSHVSPELAIRHAIEEAEQTSKGIKSFEVLRTTGDVTGNTITIWHVKLRIAFSSE